MADEFNISSVQTMESIVPALEMNLGYEIYIPEMNKPIKLNDNFWLMICQNEGGSTLGRKILPENVIVIHDDKDLPLGKIKAKRGGSAGGHNGLKSIDSQITPNYNRIRIGVGKPEEHHMDTVNFVLSKFSKDDMNILHKDFEFIAGSIDDLIKNGIEHYSSIVGQYK